MKCGEAIRFLSPYLDSELDAKTSFEIGQHLEACPTCAERFAREEALEKKLAATLRSGGATAEDDARWGRIESVVRAEAERGDRGRPGRWIAAAVALFAIGIAAFVLATRKPAEPALGALAKSASHSHDGYLAGTETPELVTKKSDEAVAFCADKLGVSLIPPDPSAFELVGVRRCAFGKVRVAYLMGRIGGEPVSAFAFPTSELASFPEARAALGSAGTTHSEIYGHELVLARGESVTVCVLAAPAMAQALEPLARAMAR